LGLQHALQHAAVIILLPWQVPGMWEAMISAQRSAPSVAWDAQWDQQPSLLHQDLKLPFSESDLEKYVQTVENGQLE